MTIGAPFYRDLSLNECLVAARRVQRPWPVTALTADIDAVCRFTDSTKPTRLIKAGAVTSDASIVVGAPFILERRPGLSMGRRLPERIGLSVAALTGGAADVLRLVRPHGRFAFAVFL